MCFPGAALLASEPPELASWIRNTTGATGYAGLPANVQSVRYSDANAYVSSSGIPAYSIGPWAGDPNIPSNQAFVFRIPRHPSVNAGTKTATPLGAIAVWTNGVAVFNALDANSYNNQNVWHQNAVAVEAASFDSCLGHPAPGGIYHHHQNPRCLYAADSTRHSPIIGYAFDGFPIYGAYGFTNADGTGGVSRMRSSYRLRNIAQRTTLPDGTVLSGAQTGPAVSAAFPLGYYSEDYEYAAGSGDLDASNGRIAVTPEYPNGTYAYFATVDADGRSAYPYAIGPVYYGVVATDNITSRGHVTVGEAVTTYAPAPGPCSVGEKNLCLQGGRFKVEVAWAVPSQAASGSASAVSLTGDTGYFWFFTNNNVELVVKVLDGRAVNDKYWVFYGALSDVQYAVTVTDTQTGAVRTYLNTSGTQASAADTTAF
jgi:hypothetical protein